jgi:hypothetical protein
MMLLIALIAGCATDISIQVDTAPCTNYDFDDPDQEGIEVSSLDGDWYVSHKGVFQGCADIFDPEVTGNGRVITVREYWESRTEDDCELCFAPTIILEQPPSGRYEIGWYVGEDSAPVDVVEFEVE